MITLSNKSPIINLIVVVILVGFISFLLLDLRFVQKEVDEIRAERRFLTLKLQEIRKEQGYIEILSN